MTPDIPFKAETKSVLYKSKLVINSLWGFISTAFQTLFLSLFFVIISRHYSKEDFSNYILATTIYQFIVGLSSMGLGTWFIREHGFTATNKTHLISKFIKIQIILGLVFYVVNLVVSFTLFNNDIVRTLSIILGTNIILDNIVYAFSSLNIAEFKQKRTAQIMAVDALLRLVFVSVIFVHPFSILVLTIILVVVRLITVVAFFKFGITNETNFKSLWVYKITLKDIKTQIIPNWRFVIIVGLSILFWRSAIIIVSKFLTIEDVANYEIAYKFFSIFIIVPMILTSTVYPQFVKFLSDNNIVGIRLLYKHIFTGITFFSYLSFAIIYTYAKDIIPFVFGVKYSLAIPCLKEMFISFLIFPTILFQANLILAMKHEKIDMYLNLIAVFIFILGSCWGLQYKLSISVVNYSVLISFLIFHLLQSLFLISLKITSFKYVISFYLSFVIFLIGYPFSLTLLNPSLSFLLLIVGVLLGIIVYYFKVFLVGRTLVINS